FHHRGERHQDRLRAPARLQAEQRPAIIDEIEFDVATAAVRLEIPLALSVGEAHAALRHGQVGREEMIADALRQPEAALEAPVAEVVEEYAADAARLAAVLEVEVVVAPALES